MKFRLIHSFMVLGVLALLICYSAFLSSPQILDENTIQGRHVEITGDAYLTQSQHLPQTNPIISDHHLHRHHQQQQQHEQAKSLLPETSQNSHQSESLVGNSLLEGKENVVLGEGDEKRDAIHNSQQSIPTPLKETKIPLPQQSNSNPISSKFPAVTTRDIYESGFSYPNPALCPNDGEDVRLFIMIMSAPSHFSARDAIRLTWAHFAQRSDISIAFLVGRTENSSLIEGLEVEKRLYDDLIIANFADSYDNLTLKTMSTLEWMETYCNQSQFTLKTDDDMFINVPNLLNFISRIEVDDSKQGKIYGRLAKKWKPVRNKKSKYYISFAQFKRTVYPDFTTGPAYLFATRLASKLFAKGMETTYLKLEDVFTTGLLAQELGIKRMNIGDFANKKVNFHKTGYCALSRLISMHMVAFHEQFELWKKLLDGRTKCKIVYQTKKSTTKKLESSGGATVKAAPPS